MRYGKIASAAENIAIGQFKLGSCIKAANEGFDKKGQFRGYFGDRGKVVRINACVQQRKMAVQRWPVKFYGSLLKRQQPLDRVRRRKAVRLRSWKTSF